MKNFKINMNKPPLTDEELNAGKDFDKLLKTYKAMKTPLFKTTKFWFGSSAAVVAASVAALVIYTKVNRMDSIPENLPFINPPIAAVNIQNDKFTINTENDSTITYKTGSKIHIPAHAFLGADGMPVKGQVDFSYREFQDAADVFLAGIPMTYDSAGNKYHFETAGMMQIGASQNGKDLKVNPLALIKVDMVSHNNEDRFNTYYLDTTKRQWQYLSQVNYNKPAPPAVGDSAVGVPAAPVAEMLPAAKKSPEIVAKEAEVAKAKNEIAQLEKQKPVAPAKTSKDKPVFSLKIDEKDFPELASYNHLKFQPSDLKAYKPEKAKVAWENVDLKRVEGTLSYEITFSNAHEKYTLVAMPAVDEKDYASAKMIFDQKYEEYQTKLAQRKEDEARAKRELEDKAKELEAKIQKEIDEQKQRVKEYEERIALSTLMYRTFQVSNFGFWNCDHPQILPSGAQVTARFEDDKSGKELSMYCVYLVEKGRNAVFTYGGNGSVLPGFKFNPIKQNMIWAITQDQRVAVIRPQQFKEETKNLEHVSFKMEVLDKKFNTTDEVKEYLQM